jgi:hypothetical protein
MIPEIHILLEAANNSYAVVEKESNVFWSRQDLEDASSAGYFPEPDCLAAPSPQIEVSGPFPGCLQQSAASVDFTRYVLIGQTGHFLIFAPPEASGNGQLERTLPR